MDRAGIWDERYRRCRERSRGPEPARVLAENSYLLPDRGSALDLACGLGANACLLARCGLDTVGWDYSREAIAALTALATATGLSLRGEVRDVVADPPQPGSFDVIVVSHFLERSLAPSLETALRRGGLLFYQTFTRARVGGGGPSNPGFRLDDNELLRLFPRLRVLVYREEGCVGDIRQGFRNEAMLVAQRK